MNGTLQAAVELALAEKELVPSRIENLLTSTTSGRSRVIGQSFAYGGGLAGVMVSYEPGAKAAALINNPSAKQLELSHFSAPKDSTGNPQEWVEGLLYFLIRENYVVFMQSMAVRCHHLEQHLGWLLTKSKAAPIIVTLADKSPKDVEQQIKADHVKSLLVGGSLMQVATDDSTPLGDTERRSVEVEGPLLDAIKAALGNDRGFNWHDGLDGNLEAKLELTFKRSTTESAQKLLDNIAVAFRNADGIETDLLLMNGQKISHNQLRLATVKQIETHDGVLNVSSVFSAMYTWLNSLANTGQI